VQSISLRQQRGFAPRVSLTIANGYLTIWSRTYFGRGCYWHVPTSEIGVLSTRHKLLPDRAATLERRPARPSSKTS
jgi:hypothetical protein